MTATWRSFLFPSFIVYYVVTDMSQLPTITPETIMSWFHEWALTCKDDTNKVNTQIQLRTKLMFEQPAVTSFLSMIAGTVKDDNSTEVALYVMSVFWELINRQMTSSMLEAQVRL